MIAINTVVYILIAVVVFGVLIFVHEFGHFITAKLCHIQVNEFALGMGPAIFKHQAGETVYSLRILPIGGFCSMEGEDESSANPRAFNSRPVWQRFLVLVAGAFMNILVGFLIILGMTISSPAIASTTVAKFEDNAVSNTTGLQAGDRIVKINGSTIHIATDITFGLLESSGSQADITVVRGGRRVSLKGVTFPMVDDGNGGKVMQRDFWVYAASKTPATVMHESYYWTISMVKLVWTTIVEMFRGRYGLKDLAGPVGTTVAMGQAASQGISSLLFFVALFVGNLGVVNLFPLPALDGGRLLFVILEGIRRKPVKPQYEGYVHFVGFVLLMLLMVVVTYNDIIRVITGYFKK